MGRRGSSSGVKHLYGSGSCSTLNESEREMAERDGEADCSVSARSL